jgi:hypothetical protein
MFSVAFLVGDKPRIAERGKSRPANWNGVTKLLTGTDVRANFVLIGDVDMTEPENEVFDGDFLSWASTVTSDNLASIEGRVRAIADGVPSTIRPELD